jgi:5'-3' exonuclease
MKNYFLVDGNSLGHFANAGARLSIGELPVQAIYNFLKNLRRSTALAQHYRFAVLWDGASWRNMEYPEYKANREKKDTKSERHLHEMKAMYHKQRPYIQKALRLLGVTQVKAANMEADDLAAIMADRYARNGRVVLWTGDKDWIQLVQPNVIWRDFANDRRINHENFEEMTGVKTPRQFVEVKALSGDQGDNIAGVGGIGETGAIQFVNKFGSFSDFVNMVTLEKSVDFEKLPKKYRALIEDETKALRFQANLDLVDLRTSMRPAPVNLQIDKGEPDAERFRKLCDLLLFESITRDLDEWLSVFPAWRKEPS